MVGPRAPGAGSASRSLPVPGPLLSAQQLFRREPRPGPVRAAAARARARRAPRPRPRSPPGASRPRPVSTLPPPRRRPASARRAFSGPRRVGRRRPLAAKPAGGRLPGLQALRSVSARLKVTCLTVCLTDPSLVLTSHGLTCVCASISHSLITCPSAGESDLSTSLSVCLPVGHLPGGP